MHQPFPAIFRGLFGQHVAQQRPTQGAAAVDDQHLALAIEFNLLLDQRVVFETLDGHDLAAEGIATAEIAEHRFHHLHEVRIGIAQVRREVMVHRTTPVWAGTSG
jgi:hypothetical protein